MLLILYVMYIHKTLWSKTPNKLINEYLNMHVLWGFQLII